jgi:archaellum component FlaD/FlaE
MATDPTDGRSGTLLVLGLGLLDWLLDDEAGGNQDQVAFGGSANADYRPDETSQRDASDLIDHTRPTGVRFGSEPLDDGDDGDPARGDDHHQRKNTSSATADSHSGGSRDSSVEEQPSVQEQGQGHTDRRTPHDGTSEQRAAQSRVADDTDTSATESRPESETEGSASPDSNPEELDQRIDAIEDEVGRLSKTVESLDTEFESLQSALGNIETDIEQLVTEAQSSLVEAAQNEPDQGGEEGEIPNDPHATKPSTPTAANQGSAEVREDRSRDTPERGEEDGSERVASEAQPKSEANEDPFSGDNSSRGEGGSRARQDRPDANSGGKGTDAVRDGGTDVGGGSGLESSRGTTSSTDTLFGTDTLNDTDTTETRDGPSGRSLSSEESAVSSGADVDWLSEADGGDDSSTENSAVSEVVSEVNEQMDRVVGNDDRTGSTPESTPSEFDQPKVGVFSEDTTEPSDDSSEAVVDDVDALLESDDWALEIEEMDIGDEDIEDILVEGDKASDGPDGEYVPDTGQPGTVFEASETEDVGPTDGAPEDLFESDETDAESHDGPNQSDAGDGQFGDATGQPERQPVDESIDPASLAETAAPADAVRTYVEEGDPEAKSVQPESTDDPFQFGKVLMPGEEEDEASELPELVGEDVEKPYLEALPSGYATDSLAIEWLGWLVNEEDPASAVDLLMYYEDAGWIGEAATDDLLVYLEGLVDVTQTTTETEPKAYDLDTHLHSLEYIKEIAADPTLRGVQGDGV